MLVRLKQYYCLDKKHKSIFFVSPPPCVIGFLLAISSYWLIKHKDDCTCKVLVMFQYNPTYMHFCRTSEYVCVRLGIRASWTYAILPLAWQPSDDTCYMRWHLNCMYCSGVQCPGELRGSNIGDFIPTWWEGEEETSFGIDRNDEMINLYVRREFL